MAEGATTREKKREELLKNIAPPIEAPKPPQAAPDLSKLQPIRRDVQEQVKAGVKAQTQEAMNAATIFVRATGALLTTTPRVEDEMRAKDSEMLRLYRMTQGNAEDTFTGCKVQYAYNQRQKIYSISAMLDNRPRIITVRVGDNFTEVSLADNKGNLLEVLRQEDKKGITFSKMG